jgi:hypothetical protein
MSVLDKRTVVAVERMVQLDKYTIVMTDYSVRKPDDRHYKSDPELMARMTRGRGISEFTWQNGQDTSKASVNLYGMHKFGNEGDYKSFVSYDVKDTHEIVTSKENGECFHVTCAEIDGVVFWYLGSKNVHGVLRNDHFLLDLENPLYLEQRYAYFSLMAKLFYAKLITINREPLIALLKEGITLVGESCLMDSPHLVRYTSDQIKFFSMTRDDETWSACDPKYVRDKCMELGLDVVTDLFVTSADDRDQCRNNFQYMTNSEGAVVYVMDSNGAVVDVYKFKNRLYVIARALRQCLINKFTNKQIIARMRNLYIALATDELASCIEYSTQFNAWMCATYALDSIVWSQIAVRWIALNAEFSLLSSADKADILRAHTDANFQYQLMSKGCPGTGKSSAFRAVAKLLDGPFVNQDDFNGNRNVFHKEVAVQTASNNPFVIIDKCMHNNSVRTDCIRNIRSPSVVLCEFYHPLDEGTGDIENMVLLSLERITQRKLGHKSLYPSNNLENILRSTFQKQWEDLTVEEMSTFHAIIRIDMTASKLHVLQYIMEQLSIHGIIDTTPSSDEMEAAINYATLVESDLAAFNAAPPKKSKPMPTMTTKAPKKSNTFFWAVNVCNPRDILDRVEVKEFLAANPNLIPNTDFHCTMIYNSGQIALDETRYEARRNEILNLQIESICYDGKGAALKLKSVDFPCNNANPHITLALAKGVPPVYSNKLLAGKCQFVVINDFVTQGMVTRH